MATRYPERSFVGDEGVDYVQLVCTRSRAFFLPRPRQDIGLDGHIEFLNDSGEPTGALAFIQCKSGLSYISTSGEYQIRANKAHFVTWSRYDFPVIGIIYNPEAQKARWVNISNYLRLNPESIENGPYNIQAPETNEFSEAGFRRFQDAIEHIHLQRTIPTAQELIDRYLLSDNQVDKDELLTVLFSQYRWTPTTCFFLHQSLSFEEDPKLVEYLTFLISFYRAHGDRFYTAENICPPELSALAKRYIAKYEAPEIRKLLSLIELDAENGLERGSLGQTIAIQLMDIPNVEASLRSIIRDRRINPNSRGYAIGILVQYLHDDELDFYESILIGEDNSFVQEAATWAIHYIRETNIQ